MNYQDFGRFGNRLFMIAGTIGIAIKNGLKFGFPPWEEQKYFNRSLPSLNRQLLEIPNLHYRKYIVKIPFDYQDIKINDGSILFGFMQTAKYFDQCEPVIRDYFKLKDNYQIGKIENNSICLHFRGTDYDGIYYPRCNVEYYLKALEILPANCKIYVFSDEVKTCKEWFTNTKYLKRIQFVENNHYINDFYLMMQCKYFIISNSTFAWWAAYLSETKDKKVIAPAVWYGKTFKHNTNDIYCPGWIII